MRYHAASRKNIAGKFRWQTFSTQSKPIPDAQPKRPSPVLGVLEVVTGGRGWLGSIGGVGSFAKLGFQILKSTGSSGAVSRDC
jgi:hypothetical protein